MTKQTVTKIDDILGHPVTLKIFIYIKSEDNESIGVREVMRAVRMSSSSTVSRHLDKLDEIGLIQKLPSNRYIITEEGSSLKNIQVPIRFSANLTKKRFITIISYQITFLLLMLVTAFILIWFDRLLAAIVGIIGIVIGLGISIMYWRLTNKQLSNFHNFEKE